MSYRFTVNVPLRWVDVDSWGVVNNAVYLNLMEQARFEYFRHLDLLVGGNVPFVLAEATVRYLKPGRMGMDVVVAARVSRLGNTSFAMDYEVRAEQVVLAAGHAALVYVDREFHPVGIPAAARSAIADFEGLDPDRQPGT